MDKNYMSDITKEDLEKLQARGLELTDKILDACKKKQYKLMHTYSLELNAIVKKLHVIQKQLKKKEKKEVKK